MKIIKLIPLSFIATAIASVSPLVSSCSCTHVRPDPGPEPEPQIIYQEVKTEDIFNKSFVRKTPRLEPQSFSSKPEALAKYLHDAKSKRQIYNDDVFLSAQDVLDYWLTEERKDASWSLTGFNGIVDFGITDIYTQSNRLTYGIKLNTTIVAKLKEYEDITIKFNVTANIIAKDIQIALDYSPEENQWWAYAAYVNWQNPKDHTLQTLNENSLRDDKIWSLSLNAKISILESSIPGIQGNTSINGKYNYQSVDHEDKENSLFWLQILYSNLWHRVDYLTGSDIDPTTC